MNTPAAPSRRRPRSVVSAPRPATAYAATPRQRTHSDPLATADDWLADQSLVQPRRRPARQPVDRDQPPLPVSSELSPQAASHVATGVSADPPTAGLAYARRILIVAEQAAIIALFAVTAWAMLAARDGLVEVHPFALAMWAMGAAVCSVTLAALATDPDVDATRRSRRLIVGTTLLVSLIGCVTGVIAAADGVAGPAWVLFLPVVVIVGAVLGAVPGLLTGALATGGTYAAAALSHTLTVGGVGRLVILLPSFPALGLAAGALCGAAHVAAREARDQRVALERDVEMLSALLQAVSECDLTVSPTIAGGSAIWSDPATEGLAVVLADTMLALRRLVGRLAGAGDALVSSVDELAATASTHVEAVESQAIAVTETTSTVDQLAATATAIAETAGRVSLAAAESRADADAGFHAVAETRLAGQRLADRTRSLSVRADALRQLVERVGATTRSMDELSKRTGMLALSASIEAASAGRQSVGFANVAVEVRALADRARAATGSIATIVAELHDEVEATAEAARQGALAVEAGLARQADVEVALMRITDKIDLTAEAAREITGATGQQRGAADGVVAAMGRVTASSGRAREATTRHSEAADRLRDLARHSADVIGTFKLPSRPGQSTQETLR